MSIPETHEERIPGFHENAEMRFEQGIDSPFAISVSRRAAKKCKKDMFLDGKVCILERILSWQTPK